MNRSRTREKPTRSKSPPRPRSASRKLQSPTTGKFRRIMLSVFADFKVPSTFQNLEPLFLQCLCYNAFVI